MYRGLLEGHSALFIGFYEMDRFLENLSSVCRAGLLLVPEMSWEKMLVVFLDRLCVLCYPVEECPLYLSADDLPLHKPRET